MNTAVSLSFVQACIFAFLACLCVAIYFGMRRQSSLAWLAAALVCGAVEVLIISLSDGTFVELLAATLLVPTAYLCVGHSVGLITGWQRREPALLAGVIGLTSIALALLLAGAPFLYQTLPFQLACGLAVSDGIIRLVRARARSLLDICLILALACIAGVFFVRLPLFPALFDSATPYLSVRDSGLEKALMRFTALATPTAVCLLLAKIIGGVLTTYRTRAEHDSLTGLFNRRAFDELFRTQRAGGGALILCDIDHFKTINDRYGHDGGDEILRSFAALLERTGQPAARIGGEEFALLLPRGSVLDAAELAGAICARFHAGGHTLLAPDHRLSASFGITAYTAGDTPRDSFRRADAALYRAKRNGRNRVEIHEDGGDPAPGARRQAA